MHRIAQSLPVLTAGSVDSMLSAGDMGVLCITLMRSVADRPLGRDPMTASDRKLDDIEPATRRLPAVRKLPAVRRLPKSPCRPCNGAMSATAIVLMERNAEMCPHLGTCRCESYAGFMQRTRKCGRRATEAAKE